MLQNHVICMISARPRGETRNNARGSWRDRGAPASGSLGYFRSGAARPERVDRAVISAPEGASTLPRVMRLGWGVPEASEPDSVVPPPSHMYRRRTPALRRQQRL